MKRRTDHSPNRAGEQQSKGVKCPLCKDAFPTLLDFKSTPKVHFAEAHANFPYYFVCSECPEYSRSEDGIKAHLRYKHADAPIYRVEEEYLGLLCSECGVYVRVPTEESPAEWEAFTTLLEKHASDGFAPLYLQFSRTLEGEPQLHQRLFASDEKRVRLMEGARKDGVVRARLSLLAKSVVSHSKRMLEDDAQLKPSPQASLKREDKNRRREDKTIVKKETEKDDQLRHGSKSVKWRIEGILPPQGVSQMSFRRASIRGRGMLLGAVQIPIFQGADQARIEYTPDGISGPLHVCRTCNTLLVGAVRVAHHECARKQGEPERTPKIDTITPASGEPNARIPCPECDHYCCSLFGLQIHLSLKHSKAYTVDDGQAVEEETQAEAAEANNSETGEGHHDSAMSAVRVPSITVRLLPGDPANPTYSCSASPVSRKNSSAAAAVDDAGNESDSSDEGRLRIDEDAHDDDQADEDEPMRVQPADEEDGTEEDTVAPAEQDTKSEDSSQEEEPMEQDEKKEEDTENEQPRASGNGDTVAKEDDAHSTKNGDGRSDTTSGSGAKQSTVPSSSDAVIKKERDNEMAGSSGQQTQPPTQTITKMENELEKFYFEAPLSNYLPNDGFFYLCRLCMTVMPDDEEVYSRHMMKHTPSEHGLESCEDCSLLVIKQEMQSHMECHKSTMVLCVHCKKQFVDEILYYLHLKDSHSMDLVHFCLRCNLATKRVNELKTHILSGVCARNDLPSATFVKPSPGLIAECLFSFEGGMEPNGSLSYRLHKASSVEQVKGPSCQTPDCVRRGLIPATKAEILERMKREKEKGLLQVEGGVQKLYLKCKYGRVSCPIDMFTLQYQRYSVHNFGRTTKEPKMSPATWRLCRREQAHKLAHGTGIRGTTRISAYWAHDGAAVAAIDATPPAAPATASATAAPQKRPAASDADAGVAPPAKQPKLEVQLTEDEKEQRINAGNVKIYEKAVYMEHFCMRGAPVHPYTDKQKRDTMMGIMFTENAPQKTKCLFCQSQNGVYGVTGYRMNWIRHHHDSSRHVLDDKYYLDPSKAGLKVCARHFAPDEIDDTGVLDMGALPKFLQRQCLICEKDITEVGIELPIYYQMQLEVLARVPGCTRSLEQLLEKCAQGIQFACPTDVIVATAIQPDTLTEEARVKIHEARANYVKEKKAAKAAKVAAAEANRAANRPSSAEESDFAALRHAFVHAQYEPQTPAHPPAAESPPADPAPDMEPPPTPGTMRILEGILNAPATPRDPYQHPPATPGHAAAVQKIKAGFSVGMPQRAPAAAAAMAPPPVPPPARHLAPTLAVAQQVRGVLKPHHVQPQMHRQPPQQMPPPGQQQHQQLLLPGPYLIPPNYPTLPPAVLKADMQAQLRDANPTAAQSTIEAAVEQAMQKLLHVHPQQQQQMHQAMQQQQAAQQLQAQQGQQGQTHQQQQRKSDPQELVQIFLELYHEKGHPRERATFLAHQEYLARLAAKANQPQLQQQRMMQQQQMQQPGAGASHMMQQHQQRPILIPSQQQPEGQYHPRAAMMQPQAQFRASPTQQQQQQHTPQQHAGPNRTQPPNGQPMRQAHHQPQAAPPGLAQVTTREEMRAFLKSCKRVELSQANHDNYVDGLTDAGLQQEVNIALNARRQQRIAQQQSRPQPQVHQQPPAAAQTPPMAGPSTSAPTVPAPAPAPPAAAATSPSSSLYRTIPTSTAFECRMCEEARKPAGTARVRFDTDDVEAILDALKMKKGTMRRHVLHKFWHEDPRSTVICRSHLEEGVVESGTKCNDCNQMYTMDDRDLHRNHNELRFCCRECFIPLRDELHVLKHMKSAHAFVFPREMRLDCPFKGDRREPCEATSTSIAGYREHLNTVHGCQLMHAFSPECPANHSCEMRFKTSEMRELHNVQVKEERRRLGRSDGDAACCPMCGSIDLWKGTIDGQNVSHFTLHGLEWTSMCRFDLMEVRKGDDAKYHFYDHHHEEQHPRCPCHPTEAVGNWAPHADSHLMVGFSLDKQTRDAISTSDVGRALIGLARI